MVRSLLQTVLLVLGNMLPAMGGTSACPDLASFQAEALKHLQRAFPEQDARVGSIDGVIEAGGFVFRLDNLHKHVCAPPVSGPEERKKMILEHFRSGFQAAADLRSGKPQGWATAREHVVIQLVRDDLALQRNMLRRPLVRGVSVVVVYDFSTAYAYVNEEHRVHWGVSREELFDSAIQNLGRRTRGEMKASGEGAERLLFVGELDGYDAARILTPGLRKAAASVLGNPFRAAIPNRDFLVMWARDNAQLNQEASANARRDFEAQPYAISPLVLEVWTDGRIAAVDPPAGR